MDQWTPHQGAPAPVDLRICVFGDSFTAAVGDPRGAGWLGPVVREARAAGLDLTAYNLGVRHDTSVDIARRWYPEARPRLEGGDCFGVVFALGTNDVDLYAGRPRVAQTRSVSLLAQMLDDAHTASWPALVIGPPPVRDQAASERAAELAIAMAAVCSTRGVPFTDLTVGLAEDPDWLREVADGDAYHPSTAGYARFGQLVQPSLLRWLTEIAAPRGPLLPAWNAGRSATDRQQPS